MHEKKPRDLETGFEAGTEIRKQAARKEDLARLLAELAGTFASQDSNRPEHVQDVVERKHVLQAADRLFGADTSWIGTLAPGSGIFLSYSTKDEDFARELETDLRNEGVTCFLAPLSIKPGASWPDEIWQAIRACRVLVLVVTAEALKSKWCLLEIGAALGLRKPLVAVLRHSNKLPDVLKPVQAMKVQTKKQQADLVQQLKKLCVA